MGLSRRKFTKELKLAAIQRVESGATAADVARAFEVTRICCIGGGRSSGMARAMRFPAKGSGVGMRRKSRNWSGRSGSRSWRLIF